MKNNLKLITFEGLDKVGKTTIHKLFDKKVKYKYLTCDRLFITYLSYCKRYSRDVHDDIYNWLKELNKKVIVVYLIADNTELLRRYDIYNHLKIDIEKDRNAFEDSLFIAKELGVSIITVDTTNKTEDETVIEIIKKLEALK